jgi:hypothetical protein
MRFNAVAVTLAAAVVLMWTACERAPTEESQSSDPLFAKGGGDNVCETKGLPVREYFGKDVKLVSETLRDLETFCNDVEAPSAWRSGFDVFQMVGDPIRDNTVAGAEIVTGVWSIMLATEAAAGDAGSALACPGCSLIEVDFVTVESSLRLGVYVVVDGAFKGYVRWDGEPIWGLEPNDENSWGELVRYERALVLGYPTDLEGGLGDDPLIATGFDWTVAPGLAGGALAVGSCALPPGLNVALYSHLDASTGLERLLPVGREPTYCPWSTVAESWGQRLTNLASRMIPLWPRDLHATLLRNKGGGGTTSELSPFFGYDVYFEGLINYLTQPGDAVQYEGTPGADSWICASGATASEAGCEEGTGIQVQLTTSFGSILDAAEDVTLSIFAEDNNGSWTLYNSDPDGERLLSGDHGLVYEWTNLALDKPGRYLLCVTNLGENGGFVGDNSTGLTFPSTCSEAFHINPR